ncbi:MAG TPA: GNAT family N-acetyltransferase [Ignavibacteriales bacterium]|nr:GNAT family N-acetyltransferase [Ignavibacteriales bacterium]
MQSLLKIRNAEKKDVPLILSLIKSLAEYEKLSHEAVMDGKLLAENLFGERKYAEVLIAEYDGKPAGFALFFHNFSTFVGKPGLYLEDVFVYPEYRGKGIGKALLIKLAQIAVERNCGRFEWSVLDWNEPAINFYKSLGAEPMDDWTIYRVAGDKLKNLANHK